MVYLELIGCIGLIITKDTNISWIFSKYNVNSPTCITLGDLSQFETAELYYNTLAFLRLNKLNLLL